MCISIGSYPGMHHRWQIRLPAVLSKPSSSAERLLCLLSACSCQFLKPPSAQNHPSFVLTSRFLRYLSTKYPYFCSDRSLFMVLRTKYPCFCSNLGFLRFLRTKPPLFCSDQSHFEAPKNKIPLFLFWDQGERKVFGYGNYL